jgi:ATP-dependent Zn protease
MKLIGKIVAINFLFWVVIFLSVVLLWCLVQRGSVASERMEISYADLVARVHSGQVLDAVIQGNQLTGHLKVSPNDEFYTVLPADDIELVEAMRAAGVNFTIRAPQSKHLDPALVAIGIASCAALLLAVIVTLPFWVIFKKAGFPPALSILMLVPLVNLIALYLVAFSEWKSSPAQKS